MVRPPKFSPKPVAATAPAKKYAKCLYTFDGGEPDELPMRKGEVNSFLFVSCSVVVALGRGCGDGDRGGGPPYPCRGVVCHNLFL